MDRDGMLSGRLVRQGEVIAQMSNFNRREGGTSYHLHFDIQVPTRHGWVFVNPYMTLVAAYERLIGARGEELPEPTEIVTTDKNPAALGTGQRAEPETIKRKRVKKRGPAQRSKKRRSRR
jgi:murein DD-endopeptidase MepM/ murein hydrolase activator NlpD